MSDMPNLYCGMHALPVPLKPGANMQLYEQAVWLFQRGHVTQAQQLCEQVLMQSENAPDVLYLMGLIAFQQKNHAQAIDYFSQVIELQPENADANFNLGQILLLTRHYASAVIAFARVLQLVPEMMQARLGLGRALAYLGQSGAALKQFENVVANKDSLISSDAALAFMYKGMLRGAQGRHQKALECFEQAISFNQQLVPAHYGRANALRALGRMFEVDKSINQLAAKDKQHAPTFFLFGTLLEETGQYIQALQCFDRVIMLEPKYKEAFDARSRVLQLLGLRVPPRNDVVMDE